MPQRRSGAKHRIAYQLKLLGSNDPETAALRWFFLNEKPALFCRQHQALWEDLCAGRKGVSRCFGEGK